VLVRLLRERLRPYRRDLGLVVLLQLVQTLATLYLPTLNADIIDHGVVTGDTGYIVRTGGVMLAITLVQITCATGAVYFGARTAMALGRDVRRALFARVHEFSAREVGRLGTPSLMTVTGVVPICTARPGKTCGRRPIPRTRRGITATSNPLGIAGVTTSRLAGPRSTRRSSTYTVPWTGASTPRPTNTPPTSLRTRDTRSGSPRVASRAAAAPSGNE